MHTRIDVCRVSYSFPRSFDMSGPVAFFLLFICASFAHAVLSPVLGPWTKQHAVNVDVTWANESAGLVEISIGATAEPIVVEVSDDVLFVIQRPGMPNWALPAGGGGGACIDVGPAMAHVWFDPTGELLLQLSSPTGVVPLDVGMRLHWRAFTFRLLPGLRSLPLTQTLLPVAVPFTTARGDDGQVTLSLRMTQWTPPTLTRELEFSTALPKSARPSRTVETCIAVDTPQWNALCQLHLATCGSVTLKCPAGMQNPVMLPAIDRAVTYPALV